MAVLGQPLTAPETGWQRFEDGYAKISYGSGWGSMSTGVASGGYYSYITGGNTAKAKIKFKGTKFRLISTIATSGTAQGKISIDGNIENFSCYSVSSAYQVMVYEKTGLSDDIHTVEIWNGDSSTSLYIWLDAVDIDSTGYILATIGNVLATPEPGWKRFDDNDKRITYTGANWTTGSNSSCYNSTYYQNNVAGQKLTFKFYGTKVRIIGISTGAYSNGHTVTIDGVSDGVINGNNTGVFQALVYEKTGLNPGFHTIEITVVNTGYFLLDAIDIDSNGYLAHPILNQVSKIEDMKIGDCIQARYKASSGAFGIISEVGTCAMPEIPYASSATPDGLFYLIHAGYDLRGRMKLVADRNIQQSISWDTLNTNGIATGEGLPIKLYGGEIDKSKTVCQGGTPFGSLTYAGNGNANAFDGDINTKAVDPNGLNGTGTGTWIGYQFAEPRAIGGMKVIMTYNTSCSFNVQYSDNGSTYTNVGTINKTVSGSTIETIDFGYFGSHKYWRINYLSTAEVGRTFYVTELEMYEMVDAVPNSKIAIRLLSGGINSTDKDNEWDKIIAESILSGKITAGDNNIWHWSGLWSWTSTTITTDSTGASRTIRGNATVAGIDKAVSNWVNVLGSFRPIILVELLNTPPKITLDSIVSETNSSTVNITGTIFDSENNKIKYKIDNGAWSDLTSGNISIQYTKNLILGTNTVIITAEDEYGLQSSTTITIVRKNTAPDFIVVSEFKRFSILENLIISTTISDTDEGSILYYKIENLTKGVILKDYDSVGSTSPLVINESIPIDSTNFSIGANLIQITAKDDVGATLSKTIRVFVSEVGYMTYQKSFETKDITLPNDFNSIMVSSQYSGNIAVAYSIDSGATWNFTDLDSLISLPTPINKMKLRFLMDSGAEVKAYGLGWL